MRRNFRNIHNHLGFGIPLMLANSQDSSNIRLLQALPLRVRHKSGFTTRERLRMCNSAPTLRPYHRINTCFGQLTAFQEIERTQWCPFNMPTNLTFPHVLASHFAGMQYP